MNAVPLVVFPQNILGKILLYFALMVTAMVSSQTTFTESGAAYGLDLTGSKDGGHAWSDFDNDGLIDVLVLESNNSASVKSFLMRQSPAGTFTNVQSTLAPGMLGDWAERQAVWGDLNGDGRPDFMINSYGSSSGRVAIQIFIQNPSGTFGDGIGGTAPITVGQNASATVTISNLNVEGTGFFDFEGDGDLDIFFDNHQYGIELLRNNFIDHITHTVASPAPAGMFTHITPGSGTGVVEFGLSQSAIDGDYGSAADVNDDGWVDIFMRKRNENDFFLNQGGTFTNGADLAQAENGNKGGNGLWDLDNDGDLDAVWTENGLNQIFRNDGPGVWTPLGAAVFPGLPQPTNIDTGTSTDRIDALAGGDIDNDGDIDILFVGNSRSYLFINQLNSPTPAPGVIGSGTAMTFSLDTATFNSGQNGEGTTMVDIDDDGDLDIYMSIGGRNRLYINNLPAANRNNHLIIDVTEDRGANGSTGGVPERVAIGTNILIRDCNGNIISGLRQVNGVYGHGTQSPEAVHLGLPLGESETYVIEVRYPNFYDPVDGFKRLIGTIITTPSTIPGTNHYSLSTTEAELSENINAPDAVDDTASVNDNYNISIQISLFDNDSEPDSENFFISSIVQPATGSVVIDDADAGLVTYTYSLGVPFSGTTFDYTISDSPILACPALGKSDTATATINAKIPEDCTNGIDDDGDGLIDCDDPECNLNGNGYDWYFGQNAGLDFENAAGPVQVPSPSMNAEEGSSVWSDDQGNLLFYTDGINVYNRNHQVMPNGSGLLGNPSSTQSGVVVEDPGNANRFYIFSIGGSGNRAYYSVVDMTLNGGLGDVLSVNKNTLIQNVNGEKIAAWPHSNGTDIWIALVDTNTIYTRLLTAAGLGASVNSNITSPGRRYGQMKFSPDGQKLAIACYPNSFSGYMVQLVDFDNNTGLFSNLQQWSLDEPYGVEFSPDGTYLYVTDMGWASSPGHLMQYDVANNITGAAIGASGVSLLSANYLFAQLQIGPDGKIYMATSVPGNNPRNGLAVINAPNSPGTAANAVADQITFSGGAMSRSGLPNIPAYQLRSKPIIRPIDITQTCFSTIELEVEAYGATSFQWLLDGIAIAGETGNTYNPDAPGQYQVEVTYGCDTEITDAYNVLRDTDNDCVDDIVDLDDDNDGILDTEEGLNCGIPADWSGASLGNPVTVSIFNANLGEYTDVTLTIMADNSTPVDVGNTPTSKIGGIGELHDGDSFRIDTSKPITMKVKRRNQVSGFWDVETHRYTFNNRYVLDDPNAIFQVVANTANSITLQNDGASPVPDANGSWTLKSITNQLVFEQLGVGNPRSATRVEVGCSTRDSDGDGIPDHIDLDSDNDGIYDAVEAGHTHAHTNGIVNGSVGTDGIPDVAQNTPDDGLVNYTVSDSDSDGIIDAAELDSDNDGCNDVIEAGYTDGNGDGLLGPNPITIDGNGLVTSAGDGYTNPADGNSNSVFDFQEAGTAPVITGQPNNTIICPGCTGSFTVTATNADTYQWQLFNGSIWVDLTDSGIYSTTTTSTLTITNPTTAENGNQYRVIVANSMYICSLETSNPAVLMVKVNTVITNRRITYRIKKN